MCLTPQHYLGHASKGVMCTLTHKGVAGGGAGVQGDSDEPPLPPHRGHELCAIR